MENAHRQRQQMADQRLNRTDSATTSSANRTESSNSTATTNGPTWQSIGPAPIISDPSGQQSYGLVSGRVTSDAVDQSDTTGNTVYVGGASGGLCECEYHTRH